MKILVKAFKVVLGVIAFCAGSILLLFTYFFLYGPERYCFFNPYIDTEMAKDYSPEKFDRVHIGMQRVEIIQLLGEPLCTYNDTFQFKNVVKLNYTNDGKILYDQVPWYMWNDYAWYRSSVFLHCDTVFYVDYGWSYD